jgi:hypothetical protein
MTDDFDFDFDLDRGRSASRTKDREPDQAAEGNGSADASRGNGGGGNGSRGDGRRANRARGNGARRSATRTRPDLVRRGEPDGDSGATTPPAGPAEDDWLSLGDDEFSPGYLSPLRQPARRPPARAASSPRRPAAAPHGGPARSSTSMSSASASSAMTPRTRTSTSRTCSSDSRRRAASRAADPRCGMRSAEGSRTSAGWAGSGSLIVAIAFRPCASGSPLAFPSRGRRTVQASHRPRTCPAGSAHAARASPSRDGSRSFAW